MRTRSLPIIALAAVLTAVAVSYPAVSIVHALEHVESQHTADPSGPAPTSDSEGGVPCDVCRSLALGRNVVAPAGHLVETDVRRLHGVEPVAPEPVAASVPRAPASPRAPPLV